MSGKTSRVVVVGAGLGGLRTVQALRASGEDREIVLIGEEASPPYDRPPLTKQVMRGERTSTTLAADWDELAATRILGVRAVLLPRSSEVIELSDGRSIGYSDLVIATGGRARTVDAAWLNGAYLLRSLEDALSVREAISRAGRITIVGAGFIGSELAASARGMGVETVLIDTLPGPMFGALGPIVSRHLAELHRSHGVDLRMGQEIRFALDNALHLTTSGTAARWPLVAALGMVPNVEWLSGSGVEVDGGIVCDAVGRTSRPRVYAVGDVAAWPLEPTGRRRRVEHWTTTVEHAQVVATTITGGTSSPVGPPYFWSDLYETKIQGLGAFESDDDVVELQIRERPVFVYYRDGILTGVAGFGAARAVMSLRPLLASGGARLGEAIDVLASAAERLAAAT